MNPLRDSVLVDDLLRIEKAIVNDLNPHFDLVSDISGHILFSGGKRIRPLLMILSSRVCGCINEINYKYSTIFEYLHAATLLHDDIVDNADVRRGNLVANRLWDVSAVLLTGDFLLARSIAIASESNKCSVVRVVADIAEKMSQGELQQLRKVRDFSLDESEYLEIIYFKTAAMFEGACKCGALLAGAGESEIKVLAEYGYNLGMAFQIVDDLSDYALDSSETGKKIGTDFKEGKLTLPVIFAIAKASRSDRDRMRSILSSGVFSDVEFSWFVSVLNEYGGIEYASKKVSEYIANAKNIVSSFTGNNNAHLLSDIATYVLARSKL